MGGIGSGARRATHVANVEDVLAVDIRALRRLGALRPGECVITPVRWSSRDLSEPHARLRVDLSEQDAGTMTITGSMPDGTITERVPIELVPAPLGGHRCYFRCPATGERCEVLYYLGGRFASRTAQRLSYAVQSMADLSRARRKAAKLRGRLRGDGNLPRPRGRNRIDLAEQLHDAEWRSRSLYHDRLCKAANRSGARRMPRVTRG